MYAFLTWVVVSQLYAPWHKMNPLSYVLHACVSVGTTGNSCHNKAGILLTVSCAIRILGNNENYTNTT